MRSFDAPIGDSPQRIAPLGGMLKSISALTTTERVSIAQIIAAIGTQAALPVLVLVSAIVISPLSAIPLFSSACGLIIVLTAAQSIVRETHLWLPARIQRVSIPSDKVTGAIARLTPVANWLDGKAKQRWRILYRNPMRTILLSLCICAGAAMPLFEIVPMSSTTLAFFIFLISFGLMVRDGVIIALAILPLVAAKFVLALF